MSMHGSIRSLARAGGFALVAALAPAACVELTAVQDDGSFQLQVGDRAQSGDFTVRFVAVPLDSRCPYDVPCTWAGDAVVRLDLSTRHYADVVDLHLNSAQGPVSEELDGHVVELLDLSPSALAGRSIPQGDYSARLRVSHF
jgi:hypothetical protein